jgi:hypothetical protein
MRLRARRCVRNPLNPQGSRHEKFFGRQEKFGKLTVYIAAPLVVFLRP